MQNKNYEAPIWQVVQSGCKTAACCPQSSSLTTSAGLSCQDTKTQIAKIQNTKFKVKEIMKTTHCAFPCRKRFEQTSFCLWSFISCIQTLIYTYDGYEGLCGPSFGDGQLMLVSYTYIHTNRKHGEVWHGYSSQ